jgi:uncharacterized protein (UPF0262 family)
MREGGLSELRIDEATWVAGSRERRHEWHLAIAEIVQEGRFTLPSLVRQAKARLTLTTARARLDVSDTAGEPISRHELLLERLRPLMAEYMETIVEMSKLAVGSNSPRLEALDIAKRLTHDEAGDTVVAMLGELRPDHATARRIFTLLVTLLYDTTRLIGPHPLPLR